jgi:hypothetical protein
MTKCPSFSLENGRCCHNPFSTFIACSSHEYGGDLDVEDKGLKIRGYESAWLADLCMAYVMDNCRNILDKLEYEGIYRDDGIVVFKGSKTTGKVASWLGTFQERVNDLAGSEFLEFTTDVWGNDKDDGRKHKPVKATKKATFCS